MNRFEAVLVALSFLIALPAFSQNESRRALTFEDRVACQSAIEQVYARHRVWPQQNAAPRPAPDLAVSREVLKRKVEDGLRKSQALTEIWGQPVTAAQLQEEINRMARDTQRPSVLRELWDALGNDPSRIAGCLALPLVAERRVQAIYETSAEAESKPSFDTWWQGIRANLRGEGGVVVGAFDYRLPELPAGAATCVDDTWRPTRSLPEGIFNATAIWTGTEMIYWGGSSSAAGVANTGSRYNPDTDTWNNLSTVNAPMRRSQHTAAHATIPATASPKSRAMPFSFISSGKRFLLRAHR